MILTLCLSANDPYFALFQTLAFRRLFRRLRLVQGFEAASEVVEDLSKFLNPNQRRGLPKSPRGRRGAAGFASLKRP